jgi:hypothetical protein
MPAPVHEMPAQPTPARRSRGRRTLTFITALLVLFIAAELFARYYLGLGDPPLLMHDSEIEYLFQPSQDVKRLGNRVRYNAYSMRADDFPPTKSGDDERRVVFIGDSVVNGGVQTDHSELATTLLQRRLELALGRRVVVGNASAASWGPPNMLAYLRKFGLLEADLLVIVLSSHDSADVPTFEHVVGVQPSFPDRKPVLAVQELLVRYIWPRLVHASRSDASVPADTPPEQKDIDLSPSAFREMIQLAKANGSEVLVAQYWDAEEMAQPLKPGHEMIRLIAEEMGVEVVQLGPAFQAARKAGQQPFRDAIHPNALGQQLMAKSLFEPLLQRLSELSSPVKPAMGALDTEAAGR